jgi:hypothetical protein
MRLRARVLLSGLWSVVWRRTHTQSKAYCGAGLAREERRGQQKHQNGPSPTVHRRQKR